jgi:hypothetical protein
MTPAQLDLLIAVAEGISKLLEERLTNRHGSGMHPINEQLLPFRRMIDIVKRQADASNG